MAKKKNKTKVKLSFTIDGAEFNKVGKIENIHEHIQEVKRGTGVKKSKKTYSRRKKHKSKSFYLFNLRYILNKSLHII